MTTTLPSTMRAMAWTSTTGGIEENLKLGTNTALPTNATSLPKDSTLIKIACTTLNPVDVKIPEIPYLGSLLFTKPAIPCADFSGTVVATTLAGFQAGDRVCGMNEAIPPKGGLAEYMVYTGKEGIVKIPDEVSFEQASAIGICALTAYQCIVPNVKEGGRVFINGGSGGTGTFGIQIAKALGCQVTATCSGPNVDLCKSLGADEVIDYRTTNVAEHLKRQGTQYDLIVTNVSAPSDPIYWNSEHYLKTDGKYITIAGDFSPVAIFGMAKMFLWPAWLGGGKRAVKFVACTSKAEEYARIVEWMSQGKVKTVVEKVYELEEAGEAFARLKSGRVRGKLVVRVASD